MDLDSQDKHRLIKIHLSHNGFMEWKFLSNWSSVVKMKQRSSPEFQRKHRGDNYLRANERMFIGQDSLSLITDTDKSTCSNFISRLDDASTPAGIQKFLSQSWEYLTMHHMNKSESQTIMIDDSSEDMSPMSEEQSPMPSFAMSSGSEFI